jgi:hypothetical protein
VFGVENSFLKDKNQAPQFFGHRNSQNLGMSDDASFFSNKIGVDNMSFTSLSLKKKKGLHTSLLGYELGLTSFFAFCFFLFLFF